MSKGIPYLFWQSLAVFSSFFFPSYALLIARYILKHRSCSARVVLIARCILRLEEQTKGP